MIDVVLTRVKFISRQDLDQLEKEIINLLNIFEQKHNVRTFTEIETIKKD